MEVTKWNGSYSTLQSYWFLCLVYLYVLLLLIFSKQNCVLLFCTKSLFTVWTGKLFTCLIFMSHISNNDIFWHSLEYRVCVCVMCRTGQWCCSVSTLYIYVWIHKTLIKYVFHWGCDLQCVSVRARDIQDRLRTSQERYWRRGKGWTPKILIKLFLSIIEF